ncbi:MAG TPA: Tm-1-like ATP-binding domain-containing protein [Candidatus Limnocylindrales bacterium]|nr:Tm-1-like ATP-binding domain-containing protein [Candidatus Limnocylindrales bacterium]
MPTIVLLGTLDTKGAEYDFVRRRLVGLGCRVVVVDAGTMGQTDRPVDVTADEVAAAAGADRAALAAAGDRGAAMAAMGEGAARIVEGLHADGRLDGILALGGSGAASLAATAMQRLPVGVPKLIVTTMASGDVRPYVGETDIAMLYPIVDIAGINRVSARILSNAAAAIAGMASVIPAEDDEAGRPPLVAATMFGVTTPCVTAARATLESLGYEVLVFHATGSGGRAMERLVRAGFLAGVLDITTTELADELVGGVLSAGPDRLEAAGELGLPQVVSLGALDMVNFGPPGTIPSPFAGRRFYEHNAMVTLMRTTPDECLELGRVIARKLNAARGPVSVFVPLEGLSMIDVAGQPFHDPVADAALVAALRQDLRPGIELVERPVDINDPVFASEMATRLDELIRAATPPAGLAVQGRPSPDAATGAPATGRMAG